VSPRFATWANDDLPKLESTWKIEQSPQEQLAEFLDEIYCPCEPLFIDWHVKPVSPLRHIEDGIWELKTADLRIFGWFFAKDCFIASAANLADTVKQLHLYNPYREEAVRFRDGLDLDNPKFVPGDNPHAVVSNLSYP